MVPAEKARVEVVVVSRFWQLVRCGQERAALQQQQQQVVHQNQGEVEVVEEVVDELVDDLADQSLMALSGDSSEEELDIIGDGELVAQVNVMPVVVVEEAQENGDEEEKVRCEVVVDGLRKRCVNQEVWGYIWRGTTSRS